MVNIKKLSFIFMMGLVALVLQGCSQARSNGCNPCVDMEKMRCGNGLVSVTKHVPESASFGEIYDTQIVVRAATAVANVKVEDTLPVGLEYVSSDPQAKMDGSTLSWNFPTMEKGEEKVIHVKLRPTTTGDLCTCLTVDAINRCCVGTFVGRPMLEICKVGPEKACLGSTVEYHIEVANNGDLVARDVVLRDEIPAGMSHASGKKVVEYSLGDLKPCQSKSVDIKMCANQRGQFTNIAQAMACNSGRVSDTAVTRIYQQNMEISKTGPSTQFVCKNARYEITVSNTGDEVLNCIKVQDRFPSATQLVSAEGATVSGRTVEWMIPELQPNESERFYVTLTTNLAGDHTNHVCASNDCLSESTHFTTHWKGHPALLIESVDTCDPVRVGDRTTYEIRLGNQGSAPDTNVSMQIELSSELKPVQASGSTSGMIRGNTVTFEPISEFDAKGEARYRVVAEGVRAGSGKMRIRLSSDTVRSPIIEEESTQVF